MDGIKYVAVRSGFFKINLLLAVVLCILGIIPGVIYIAACNIIAHHFIIEFYDNKVILKAGVLNKSENEMVFKGVLSVSVNKSLRGSIFNYGDVRADVVGKNNLTLTSVKKPDELKKYLLTRKVDADSIQNVVTN